MDGEIALAASAAVSSTVFSVFGYRRIRSAQLIAAGETDPRAWSVWRAAVRPLARALEPKGKDLAATVARLQPAGRSGRFEVARFTEERALGLVLGMLLGALAGFALGGPRGLLVALGGFAIGYLAPGRLVDSKAEERKQKIGNALPSAIDLLMTCVDAGLSIEQSIHRVASEYARSSPDLAAEFAMTSTETDAGVSLSDALHRMAHRVCLDDMTGLCAVIAQANELGAPIVETLAEYADSARKLRMAKLEEWAGKLAMKMLFPVALFLLPASLLVMLGPSMMSVVSAIGGF
jgi:tight adherence protein C